MSHASRSGQGRRAAAEAIISTRAGRPNFSNVQVARIFANWANAGGSETPAEPRLADLIRHS